MGAALWLIEPTARIVYSVVTATASLGVNRALHLTPSPVSQVAK